MEPPGSISIYGSCYVLVDARLGEKRLLPARDGHVLARLNQLKDCLDLVGRCALVDESKGRGGGVIASFLECDPMAGLGLPDLPSRVGARENIQHRIAGLREHPDKKLGELCRESSG